MTYNPRAGLTVNIVEGKLRIEVGVETLADCANALFEFENTYPETEYRPWVIKGKEDLFAKVVQFYLEEQDTETGATVLSKMFSDAFTYIEEHGLDETVIKDDECIMLEFIGENYN